MKNRVFSAALGRWSLIGSLASVSVVTVSCSSSNDSGGTVQPPNNPSNPGAGSAGSTGTGAVGDNGTSKPDLGPITPGDSKGPCTGLACQVQACAGGGSTTISGKVFDPAGKMPLYNVLVYVPNGPVEPFKEGATCDRCDARVLNPVTSAVTDEGGSFKLKDAPVGSDIPLVIQVGKWRRQLKIPAVAACADTALTDPQVTRLPRNKAEGDIPRIAISVGAADQMECLPLRMGIDPAEFTSASGDGRIHLFVGHHDEPGRGGLGGMMAAQPVVKFDDTHNAGATLTSADDLWASTDTLMKYDITILSCEGDSYSRQKPMATRQAMYDYASRGGRVFASHWHKVWFEQGPDPLPTTGTWNRRTPNPAGTLDDPNGDGTPQGATINQTFPKGEALAKWLVNVGASMTPGAMDVVFPRDDIQVVNAEVAREWISVNNPNFPDAPKAVQYMSFNTPIGASEDKICGREVFTDLHVASVDNNTTQNELGFPASCEVRDLSAQEKAVAFMLFDLSACVQNEDKPPTVPR